MRASTTVALVGCGLWGRNILRELRHFGVRAYVADPREDCRAAAMALGADAAFEAAERLPATQGIIVATPASTHAQVVISLCDRGVPIMVEKPLTTSVDDAARLVEIVGARVFVMHIWRYHPGVRMLAAIAQSRELGEVHGLRSVRANWRSPRTDVDTVWTMAPHDLSLSLAVLGQIPEVRYAVPELLGGRAVGLVAVLGEKPWVVMEVSNRYRDKRREVRLHCREGVAVLPDADCGYLEITRDGDPNVAYDSRTERRPYDPTPPLRLELADFLDYLNGGDAPCTDAHEGLAVVTAVAALRRCAGLD